MFGSLTLAEANSILGAAISEARELNISVSVTVCDHQGHLIALNRMDGVFAESDRFSIGKAIASAATGLPSGQIEGMVYNASAEVAVAEGMPAYRVRGGLPIFRGGQVVGGCGVEGAPSHEQEEECARVGIASLPRLACVLSSSGNRHPRR
jgi:glc operon protein GlcG